MKYKRLEDIPSQGDVNRAEKAEFNATIKKLEDDLTAERGKVFDAEMEINQLHSIVAECKAEWFKKGQESVKRKNASGCCCIINDNDEIESSCGLHTPFVEKAEFWDWCCNHDNQDILWHILNGTIEYKSESDSFETAVKAAKGYQR